MIRKRFDKKNKFMSVFNTDTGEFMRTGILKAVLVPDNGAYPTACGNEKSKVRFIDTCVDPFMAEMPELIDVGIMGHCIHGKKGLCVKSGVKCYQNGLNTHYDNMKLDDFKSIVDQAKDYIYSIALGGRGDPNKHQCFKEICKYCVDNKVVPNYTTSGLDLTDEEIAITKKYCGAVAVSEYRNSYTRDAIKRFIDAGMRTNIHYVISNTTIDDAVDKIENCGFDKGINAVVFLLHKPVGLGGEDDILNPNDKRVQKFFELVDKFDQRKEGYKIGFDSCIIPGIINYTSNIDLKFVDTCEGGRFSMYITSDMMALPCSFDNDKQRWGVSLKCCSIMDAWNSKEFSNFRSSFKTKCSGCSYHDACLSGCPICPSVVLCSRKERDF